MLHSCWLELVINPGHMETWYEDGLLSIVKSQFCLT